MRISAFSGQFVTFSIEPVLRRAALSCFSWFDGNGVNQFSQPFSGETCSVFSVLIVYCLEHHVGVRTMQVRNPH